MSTGSEVAGKLSAQRITRGHFFRLGVMPFLEEATF